MLILFGIVTSENVPILIKHDEKISLLPLYRSEAGANKYFSDVVAHWPEPESYKIIEWDDNMLNISNDVGKQCEIEIAIRVLD